MWDVQRRSESTDAHILFKGEHMGTKFSLYPICIFYVLGCAYAVKKD